ncbi:LysR family transcriptional regulator [Streptomyces longispororuber]|uniref:helix-turn-helix domain-containing protein n=1 Tax=Streptomyces longispororuber TaxID=68230 RepID=UPI0036FF60C3
MIEGHFRPQFTQSKFGRAAAALTIAQQTLSSQITALESRIGVPLSPTRPPVRSSPGRSPMTTLPRPRRPRVWWTRPSSSLRSTSRLTEGVCDRGDVHERGGAMAEAGHADARQPVRRGATAMSTSAQSNGAPVDGMGPA